MKTFLLGIALAVSAGAGSAQAQINPSPIPGIAPVSSEHTAIPKGMEKVKHTGTDALSYDNLSDPNDRNNGQSMQIMTWDEGDAVYVSWDFYLDGSGITSPNLRAPNSRGFLGPIVTSNSSKQAADPDVVLAYMEDPSSGNRELYANLVYIDGDHTQYMVYKWNTSNRTFDPEPGYPKTLGHPRFVHSYPNIDANSSGLVAITWQQSVEDDVEVTVASTNNYFPTYTFTQHVSFGLSVVAGSDIMGNIRPCYYEPRTGYVGINVINPPKGLFEQTLRPDVAISEGEASEAVISSSFLRHYVGGAGLFSIGNRLMVVQTKYDVCSQDDHTNQGIVKLGLHDSTSWAYSQYNILGTPRIAATSLHRNYFNYGTDVEVAVDRTIDNCVGTPTYDVMNFGKSNGVFRSEYTLISPLGDPNRLRSLDPVVSFSAAAGNRNGTSSTNYMISWTGGAGYNRGNSNTDDIWAVSLHEGVLPNGAYGPNAQSDFYSGINKQQDGTQGQPSIAGRHLTGNLFGRMTDEEREEAIAAGITPGSYPQVHLFYDAALKQLSYRRTGEQAGTSTPLQRGASPAPASSGADQLAEAYPNPSEGAVTVSLHLQKGETVRQLQVMDALGRSVADLSQQLGGETGNWVVWKPAASLPAGLYTVRVVTTARTANLAVSRK